LLFFILLFLFVLFLGEFFFPLQFFSFSVFQFFSFSVFLSFFLVCFSIREQWNGGNPENKSVKVKGRQQKKSTKPCRLKEG